MNSRSFARFSRWLNLPTGVLMALLQRSPALKVIAAAGEYVIASPVGTVLKGVITAAASLGAVNSMAGATTLSATSPSPLAATVGTPVSVAITILGTQTPALSWSVSGTVPAGLAFYSTATGGTGATSGTVNTPAGTLYLRGTPTSSGNATISLRAWEFANATGISSPLLSYIVNVTGSTVTAPTITTQPTSQTVSAGANVSFSVTATGTGLMYQWRKDGTAISGATSATLSLTNVQTTATGNYSVVVSNDGGSVTSSNAMLTVNAVGSAPVITTQPVAQTVAPGGSVTMTVAASGTGLSYQWQNNGANVAGATAASLTINNLQSSNGGDYTVTVTNTGGSTTSDPATLTVATPVMGRLSNLSVRTVAGTGSSTLIAGFIVNGSGNKSVVLRGTGQTLALPPFNLTGVLSDPLLTLIPLGGSTPIATNDSWQQAANLPALTAGGYTVLGPTPLAAKDCLIMTSVASGGYTAQLTDVGGMSGLGLVEVFDPDNTPPGSPGFDTQPQLVNLSARAMVGSGANVLIAGFICNGTIPLHLMIRATGPTLAQLGVGGVLLDPKLEIRRLGDSKLFAQNDDWGSAPNQAEIASVGGDKLANITLSAKESVIVTRLAPGAYTAIVSGVNSSVGNALVEVYLEP